MTSVIQTEEQQTCILYSFFWMIPRRLNSICRRFGTLCLFHLHSWCKQLPKHMKMELAEYSETSAHKIQTQGNHPKERIQYVRTRRKIEIKNKPVLVTVTTATRFGRPRTP